MLSTSDVPYGVPPYNTHHSIVKNAAAAAVAAVEVAVAAQRWQRQQHRAVAVEAAAAAQRGGGSGSAVDEAAAAQRQQLQRGRPRCPSSGNSYSKWHSPRTCQALNHIIKTKNAGFAGLRLDMNDAIADTSATQICVMDGTLLSTNARQHTC